MNSSKKPPNCSSSVTILPGLFLAMSLAIPARSAEGPDGAELFAKHFTAVGGLDALRSVESVTVTGTVQGTDRSCEFEFQAKEHMILLTKRYPSGKWSRSGRDSRGSCWQQDEKGIREAERREVGDMVDLAIGLVPSVQVFLGERLGDAITESDSAWNRPAFATGRKTNRRGFARVWFDAGSGLMVGAGHARMRDYRAVGEIRLPHEIQYAGLTVYSVKAVRLNDVLTERNFERPGGKGGLLAGLTPGMMLRFSLTNLASRQGRMEIVRRPLPATFAQGKIRKMPTYDPDSGRHGQVDLRGADLRQLDLATNTVDLLHADFDSLTLWPPRLPAGFDPGMVLELGKNPGLGVRELHLKGITGKGVGVGIIDMELLTEHVEYAGRLRLYEEIHALAGGQAHMHAAAVASIAVGKTCGVAPEADLYQIGVQNSNVDKQGKVELDYLPVAAGINRLLDLNQMLPADRKIRVISISMGWGPGTKGNAEANAAVQRAAKENVFVISTSLKRTHHLVFDGLNRAALAAPEEFDSYGPGSWWATIFWSGEMRFKPGRRLCVPMDARTVAGPKGSTDYAHYDNAGWSWAVPWVAGLYALACQVRPDITPEVFWAAALRTGKTIDVRREGEVVPFGTIAAPQALIEALGPGNPNAIIKSTSEAAKLFGSSAPK